MAVEPMDGDLPSVTFDEKMSFDDSDGHKPEFTNEMSTVPTNMPMKNLWKHLKIDEGEAQKYRSVFSKVDRDGDGALSIHEIGEAFRNLNMHLSDEQLKDLMFDNDLDGSGLIDEREFLIMVSGKKKLRTEKISTSDHMHIKSIFDIYTNDGDCWTYSNFRDYFNVINQEQNVAALSNQDFIKVNVLLGADEANKNKMTLKQLEKFYSLLDRQVKPNLMSDYNMAIVN